MLLWYALGCFLQEKGETYAKDKKIFLEDILLDL